MGRGDGLAAGEISLPAAAVERRVAIQHFLPEAAVGHADTVVLSRHRRKIADKEQLVRRIPAASEEADDAALRIAAIHPLKAGGIEIGFEAARAGRDRECSDREPSAAVRRETEYRADASRGWRRGSTPPIGRIHRP